MEMTIWLAKLLGPVLVVLAFPMLAFPKDLQKIAAEFIEQRPLIWFTGVAVMTGGLAIVNTHNVWVADWPVIITLFGWAMLISGAGRLAFPHVIIRISNKMMDQPLLTVIAGAVWILIGGFLLGVV
jgi:hypothetical protein